MLEGTYGYQHMARMVVESEGVSFESMHLPQGVAIFDGGSLTMSKCTSTGDNIHVRGGGSLVMEDTRVFGTNGHGVWCEGGVKMTRCTVEGNSHSGVYVHGEHNAAELVDCEIRKNRANGMFVSADKATLRGGVISENKGGGVIVWGGKVTVAKAEKGMPQTVTKDNTPHDWRTMDEASEMIGIPQVHTVANW